MNQNKLQKAIEHFKNLSQQSTFLEDEKERKERILFYQDKLNKDISNIDFEEMIAKLWAMRIWGNKDYIIQKMINENGLRKMVTVFKKAKDSNVIVSDLYEEMIGSIKYMGPSIATELLCYFVPYKAGIWNTRAREALLWLEIKDIPLKYRISGEEYKHFNTILVSISQKLKENGFDDVDLLLVDYFLWEITEKFEISEEIKSLPKQDIKNKSRHDELRDKIAMIGSWLGFEIDTERQIAHGAVIDTVWEAKIANLGKVTYVFEVQDKGSIDSLILNLQRAQSNSTVQKLIVVSDEDQIEKVKKEIGTMPETFRKATKFWTAIDVDKTYNNLEQVTNSISQLNLVDEA